MDFMSEVTEHTFHLNSVLDVELGVLGPFLQHCQVMPLSTV